MENTSLGGRNSTTSNTSSKQREDSSMSFWVVQWGLSGLYSILSAYEFSLYKTYKRTSDSSEIGSCG
jgi:hypothetical protein